jgi:hypothetical protein
VAICNYVDFDRNVHAVDAGRIELTNTIVGELIARGYEVVVVGESETGERGLSTRAFATATMAHSPGDIEGPRTRRTHESSRFLAAEEARADLLFEFSTQATGRMDMKMSIWASPIPFVPAKTNAKTQWTCEIRQISLRIWCPGERVILAVATVQYESPEKEWLNAVRDVCLGLDLMRRGELTGTVKMRGKPGVYKHD